VDKKYYFTLLIIVMSNINKVVTGQLVSTVATGTAPFTVVNTDIVDNLTVASCTTLTSLCAGSFDYSGSTRAAVTLTTSDRWAQALSNGSAFNVTLPSAVIGHSFFLSNIGAGTATIKGATGSTITTLTSGQWAILVSEANGGATDWKVLMNG